MIEKAWLLPAGKFTFKCKVAPPRATVPEELIESNCPAAVPFRSTSKKAPEEKVTLPVLRVAVGLLASPGEWCPPDWTVTTPTAPPPPNTPPVLTVLFPVLPVMVMSLSDNPETSELSAVFATAGNTRLSVFTMSQFPDQLACALHLAPFGPAAPAHVSVVLPAQLAALAKGTVPKSTHAATASSTCRRKPAAEPKPVIMDPAIEPSSGRLLKPPLRTAETRTLLRPVVGEDDGKARCFTWGSACFHTLEEGLQGDGILVMSMKPESYVCVGCKSRKKAHFKANS